MIQPHRMSARGLLGLTSLVALVQPGDAEALGPRGLSGSAQHPSPVPESSPAQRLEVGFHAAPLLGFESNYQVTTRSAEASGLFALDAGAELRYRPGPAVRLRVELGSLLRLPFEDAGLTEVGLDLPALLLYRLSPRFELRLGNHLAVERGKTPPVFIDPGEIDPARLGGANRTIRYASVKEELQPALGIDLAAFARVELGPYLRVKQVSFLEHPWEGDPDYRLLDGGGSLTTVLSWRGRLSARLRYDVARRLFFGWPARPPSRQPALGEDLAMTRHLLGLRLRGRIWGPLGAQLGYLLRVSPDTAGFYAALDHQGAVGLWLDTERVEATVDLSYLRRRYRERTPCEAEEDPPGSGRFLGADCRGVTPPSPLPQWESALVVDARVTVHILGWLQAIVWYELEDARSNLETIGNHRLLGGAGFSL